MQTGLKTSYRHDPKAWESCLFLSNICWENSLYLAVDLFWHLRPNFPGFSFFSSSFLPIFPVSSLNHLAVVAEAQHYPFFLPVTVGAAGFGLTNTKWSSYMPEMSTCVSDSHKHTRYCITTFWKKTFKYEWLQNQLSFAALNVEPLRVLMLQLNFWVWRKLSL